MGLHYRFDDVQIDVESFRLLKAGRAVAIEPKALNLLIFLVEHRGRLVERREILSALWNDAFVTDHVLNRAVGQLRKVLEDDAKEPRYIETVPTRGYRFVGEVIAEPYDPPVVPGDSAGSDASSGRSPLTPASVSAAEILPAAAPPPGMAEEPVSRGVRLFRWVTALAALSATVFLIPDALHLRGDLGLRDPFAGSNIQSVGILPLENLSGDPGQEYFAGGMTDELTTMLAKNSTLRVTSRTSTMQYKGVHRPLREIARELDVDAILEGAITRTGDQVHMNLQLIQASNDAHIWAESYDRSLNDVAGLPREAAQTMAGKLNKVTPHLVAARYVSPEAHDAYLHGRYLMLSLNGSETAGTYEQAHQYFEKAIELQPDYSDAWSGLADFYAGEACGGLADPREALGKETAAARKAVELDDSSAAAHLSLAASYFLHDWNWALAQREIDRALELNPRLAAAYALRCAVLETLNRHAEAIEAVRKGAELGPSDKSADLANTYINARQFDQALTAAQDRLVANPNDPDLHFALSWVFFHYGRNREGTEEKEKAYALSGDNESVEALRRTYRQGGYKATLLWRFNQNKKEALTGYVPPVDQATVAARLGRGDVAIAYLEKAYQEHSPALLELQSLEPFDFLHGDARYRSIIQRVGLPPAY